MSTRKLILKFAKPYPGLIILTMLLGFSGALFNGVGVTLIVPVILRIVGQPVDLTGFPPILKAVMFPFDNLSENYRNLGMAGTIVFVILLKNLSSYFSILASSVFTRRLNADIREASLELLLDIDIDYYSKMKVGDIINRLGSETARTSSAIGTIINLIILIITILVFVGLLLAISWQLTIAATILLGFITLINQYTISRAKKFGQQLSEMSTSYSISVLETLNGIRLVKSTANEDRDGIRLVKSTANEDREYQKITKLIRDREKADFQSQVNSQAIGPISEVMGVISLLLIVFLSKSFFANQVSFLSTVLLTYLLVLLRLLPLVSQLNSLRSSFANSAASVGIVTEFLSRDRKPFMKNGNVIYTELKEGINFNFLSFAYPGHEKLVL